ATDRREAVLIAGEAQQARLAGLEDRHVRDSRLAPEAEQRRLARRQAVGHRAPGARVDRGGRPVHQLRRLATYWNQSTSAGGSQIPAASTRARCRPAGRKEAFDGSLRPSGSPNATPLSRRSKAPRATSSATPRMI